ncbi:type II toxin-antitoxin system HipA family toxin [Luteipulveratus mongoliensis]|uniref:Phosphatidylinositol kinase n=1 Tax=Luteipulveratus mongoliensis TaxID=571913 RepID=A0A0K1JE45_9MICO|nr:HipA domain-containing protein [Luteipulveratus mongoliensis]AKU14863.1 hypothetical protein VV02_01585 [Luteipulveratus mongoliensis]
MGAPDPRDVAVADVYKAGRLAATLTRDSGGTTFAYLPAYLASGAPAVATTLPLSEEPRHSVGGAVPAYFAGLLPEGRRLTNLRQTVKTSADDELSLLLAVGRDPVGDVQVFPHGVEPSLPESPVVTSGSFADLDFTDLLADSGIVDPSALAGAQDKVSGRMLTVPLAHQGRAHLLKLNPPEYPHVVENEAYFLAVARRLRHPVAEAEVVHDRNGRAGLLVTRFDRSLDGDVLVAHAVEDASQLLDRHPADKYTVTSEAVAQRIGEVSAARSLALRAVFTQLAFAWATGNGDLHAKNISVLRRGSEWQVVPIYDIPSTIPYADHTAALSLAGRRDGFSRKRFLTFADTIGLPERAAVRALDEVLRATEPVIEGIDGGAVPFDTRRQRDLVRGLKRRRANLGGSG